MPYDYDPFEHGYGLDEDNDDKLGDTQKFDVAQNGFGSRTPEGIIRTSEEKHEPPSRARRPVTGCLPGILYFLFVVGISTIIAAVVWIGANDALGLMKENHIATVNIPENYTIGQVADILKEAKIIENPFFFKIYADISHAEETISPGIYELDAKLDYRAIVHAMRKNSEYRTTTWVTIPEGFTQEQVIARLEEKGVAKKVELEEAAQNYEYKNEFIKDLPKTENRLEGYLFPDSYLLYVGEDPATALGRMLTICSQKFTADMRKRAEDLGLTIHEVMTIASIIEREKAAGADEAGLISSVIYNRLKKEMNLCMDSTIQYILPPEKRKLWLTYEDTQIDNPYNTYLYPGLPPGPIANPGLESINAALYPETSNYLYFALTDEGVHKFSKTAAEHEAVLAANQNNRNQ